MAHNNEIFLIGANTLKMVIENKPIFSQVCKWMIKNDDFTKLCKFSIQQLWNAN